MDERAPDNLWQFIDESSITTRGERVTLPESYRTARLNRGALMELLSRAPLEFTDAAKDQAIVLSLPMPDGKFASFRVVESPIMEPELAAQFPEIKTYRGQGIDDPTATVRLDLTPAGFHAQVLSENGTTYIDPYAKGDLDNYIVYDKRDARRGEEPFVCHFTEDDSTLGSVNPDSPTEPSPSISNGNSLRTYRLALAATGEYTQAAGGTVALALARMTTTMNRVNGIYEREVGIRMILVNNESSIIYTNSATDPYTNSDGFAMSSQNQTNLDTVIGSANYDIGHVFSTGGGGVAALNSPCDFSTKARGVTGLPNPVGDPFDVDFVAHEMGHQFGAPHTFNGTTGNCSGVNRSSSDAYEPGSGSTIQAYAGICGAQNLQPNSNDYFHIKSLERIIAFTTAGGGSTCDALTTTGNTAPTVSAGADFTIPRNTPFTLTATGSDPNGDALTYAWEEYDLGLASPPDNDNDGQARPIFRSYLPVSSPTRTFPSLQYILNNANQPPANYACATGTCVTGEALPTISRTMNFQVTARDNRSGGGGISSDTMQVNVNAAGGPFVMTQPNTAVSWAGGSTQTVTWNVAGTTAAPISCANVKISLSTDGGNTFPVVLAASTPNDGSQAITVPNTPTAMARVKVEAVGNIFFDISNTNFTITGGGAMCPTISNLNPTSGAVGSAVTITGANFTGVTAVKFSNNVTAASTVNSDTQITATVPNGAVSGPIVVSKAGCPDAQTTTFTVGNTPPGDTVALASGVPQSGSIPAPPPGSAFLGSTQYTIQVPSDTTQLKVDLSGNQDVDLFVRFGQRVAIANGEIVADYFSETPTNTESITITGASSPPLQPGTYFIGVGNFGPGAANFTVTATVTSGVSCPTVSNISPTSGAVNSTVTTTGTNFTGVSSVRFANNVAAAFTVTNSTQITATVPGGAVSGPIVVSKAGCPDAQTTTFTVTGGGGTSGLQYHPLPSPIRLLDTRVGELACDAPGTPLTGGADRAQNARLTCNGITIPAAAQAVVGNATVVNNTGAGGGFVTLYPSGAARPTVSNLNYSPGEVVPNSFTVGLGVNGAFNIFATSSINFIVDVTGYYAPPSAGGLYYHPLPSPIRLLDTRAGELACDTPGTPLTGGADRTQNARLTCNGITIPAAAQAVVGNATVVNNTGAGGGFVTLFPSGAARPTVSNLNYSPGQVVPNSFTVGLGSGSGAFNIYATSSINFIVDVTGYYSNQAVDINGTGLLYNPLSTPIRLLDTRAGESACDTPGTPLTGGADRAQNARLTCNGITIPSNAQAIVGNATVVNDPAGAGGFVTLYPSGAARPTVSNLNYNPGQVVPNAFTVTLSGSGAFNIYATSSINFIADVTGYYAAP